MLQIGTVLAVDEKGASYEAVCNLGCPHTVTPVTRFSITIVEEKKVRDWFGEGWGNTGPRPATLPAFRGVDADGTEWRRDWDGWVNELPGPWITSDGRRAETASTVRDPAAQYAGRKSEVYTFTDLTHRLMMQTTTTGGPHDRPVRATGKDVLARTSDAETAATALESRFSEVLTRLDEANGRRLAFFSFKLTSAEPVREFCVVTPLLSTAEGTAISDRLAQLVGRRVRVRVRVEFIGPGQKQQVIHDLEPAG
jgi:hypothetical protein